jgi:hypothetical protein
MKSLSILLACALLACAGCANHKTEPLPELGYGQNKPQDEAKKNGIVFMVRPIHEKAQMETYFKDDLLEHGILPIQIHVCNESYCCPVTFESGDLALRNAAGEAIPAMPMDAVLEKAERSYVESAGSAAIFGVVGLAISAGSVTNTNQNIRADYNSRKLKCGKLVPGDVMQGLVFYKVPPELDSLKGWKLTLKVTDPAKGKTTSLRCKLKGSVEPRPAGKKLNIEEIVSQPEG